MTEYRSDREQLINVREERRVAERLEFRKDTKTGDYILEGYASTYDPYDVHGGPAAGGWVEQLRSTAFDGTLADQPDVQLLINHAGEPLARTKSGTMKLSTDGHGLRVWARLDPSDPDVQRIARKMIRRDMDEMSFAFRVKDQSWDSGYTHRTINDLSLEKGDVSVVNYGMNPHTRATLASEAVGMLSQLSTKELAELRSKVDLDPEKVKRAARVLSAISAPGQQQSMGAVRVSEARKPKGAAKEPYGDVTYADPGYKSDGKKRYPINSAEKVRAAWSYINMPKNQKGYSSSQVSAIKGRITGAAKRFGVDIGENKSAAGLLHVEIENNNLVAVMSDGSRVPLPAQRALPAGRRERPKFNPDADVSWHPNASPADPHDEQFGEGVVGKVGEVAPDWGFGPVPGNIVGDKGKFTGQHPTFTRPSPESDPHDQSTDDEEMLAMDPHDTPYGDAPLGGGSHLTPTPQFGGDPDPHNTPYSVGSQVGSVSGDRPGGAYAKGPIPPNIVTTGAPLGTGNGVSVSAPPATGTNGPVDTPAHPYDWTNGDIGEPGDPDEELDHSVGQRAMEESDMEECADGSWAPTNIVGGDGGGHDAGDSDEVDNPNGDAIALDMCMAEALDSTIVNCYNMAKDNEELRKRLVVARRQLSALRGLQPERVSDVSRKMDELHRQLGKPETGTVTDYFHWVRNEGSAPVGYRGILDSDPSAHVTTPGERLLREAREKEVHARKANAEADVAAQRVKKAQREAELNEVIRRTQRSASERPRRV